MRCRSKLEFFPQNVNEQQQKLLLLLDLRLWGVIKWQKGLWTFAFEKVLCTFCKFWEELILEIWFKSILLKGFVLNINWILEHHKYGEQRAMLIWIGFLRAVAFKEEVDKGESEHYNLKLLSSPVSLLTLLSMLQIQDTWEEKRTKLASHKINILQNNIADWLVLLLYVY